jgi:hypothetical protein
METALHEDSCAAYVNSFPDFLENDVFRQYVPFLMADGAIESAKAAVFRAEVRVIDVSVDDVTDHTMWMKLSAYRIRLHPNANKIIAAE